MFVVYRTCIYFQKITPNFGGVHYKAIWYSPYLCYAGVVVIVHYPLERLFLLENLIIHLNIAVITLPVLRWCRSDSPLSTGATVRSPGRNHMS